MTTTACAITTLCTGVSARAFTYARLAEFFSNGRQFLVELLAPYPDIKIILSTSWVRVRDYNFAKSKLPPALQARVVGATYHSREMQKFEFDNMSRGAQIYADVQRRNPANWLAIDNDDNFWPAHCRDHFIKTQDELGLSDTEVQTSIRARLASFALD